jgi:hypothetical protein
VVRGVLDNAVLAVAGLPRVGSSLSGATTVSAAQLMHLCTSALMPGSSSKGRGAALPACLKPYSVLQQEQLGTTLIHATLKAA